MRRHALALAAVLIFIAVGAQSTRACWCRKDPEETNTDIRFRETISNLLSSYEFVFSGTPIVINESHITFTIHSMWKGDGKDRITFNYLYGPLDTKDSVRFIDSCEFSFKVGSKYLIYAAVGFDGLRVSKCGRSNLVEKAQRDIDVLNSQKRLSGAGGNDF